MMVNERSVDAFDSPILEHFKRLASDCTCLFQKGSMLDQRH